MPQSDISSWLQFAIQQMAAESYLDALVFNNTSELIRRLEFGNNNATALGLTNPDDSPDLLGKTRFVNLSGVPNANQITGSAQAFVSRYQIVDHHANDSTGFSATLLFDTQTNSYTLSFRSTEYKNQVDGGDYERDGANGLFLTGADGEIVTKGFAFGQLAAMEQYYQTTVKNLLPAGAVLNVTGYSLGAHLATVFTELHGFETTPSFSFGHTYTFNGPGRGEFSGGQQAETVEAGRIREMITRMTQVLSNPMAGIAQGTPEALWPPSLNAALLAWQQNPTWDPWASGSTQSVYADARYLWAKQVVENEFSPVSRSLSDISRTDGAFSLITQVVGHASQGDTEYVANSGNYAAETSVFIEDQPNFDGFGGFFGASGDFGTTHSITLIVDSLALQELFQTIAPTLQQGQVESILWASSNELATGTTIGTSGTAEAKPLENALDALRRLFLPGPVTETTADPATGGFGNLANRNKFYEGIAAVKTALAGGTVTIEPLVELNAQSNAVLRLTPSEVKTAAGENTDRGLAVRYALKNLNPFAVIGADYQALGHASNGQLALFDPTTGFGALTDQYLTDRAAFLEEKIELNLLNNAKSSGNVHFKDFAPNGLEITTTIDLRVDQEFLFGSDGDEGIGVLVGNGKDDHLYGGGGNDLLEGGDGQDYLQGDDGIDRLDGGDGADTMVGGTGDDFYIVDNLGDQVSEAPNQGHDRVESSVTFKFSTGDNLEDLTLTGTNNIDGTGNELNNTLTGNAGINRLDGKGGTDHLIGNGGNDVLAGGIGDDLLEGGEGKDIYSINSLTDGNDTIEDSDATGVIKVDGRVLVGGIKKAGDTTWKSPDGQFEYRLEGGHLKLTLNGNTLTINENFQSGQFGITLMDEPDIPLYDNGRPVVDISSFVPGVGTWVPELDHDHNYIYSAPEGGFLTIALLSGNDQIYDSSSANFITAGDGHDRIYGGGGNDTILGGNYFLSQQFSLPFEEADGDDFADGQGGDDAIEGDGGNDRVYGGDGNDRLWGDAGIFGSRFSPPGGDDLVDGGAGDDFLWGDYGADILVGGVGNDVLVGDYLAHSRKSTAEYFLFDRTRATDDFLDGGEGADILFGDGGNDTLVGGAGDDVLVGDYGAGTFVAAGQFLPEDGDLTNIAGNDVLDGGAGNDFLYGMGGDDVIGGGEGVDVIFGDFDPVDTWPTADAIGNDVIDAGGGDDYASGGSGDDILFGGTGHDRLWGDSDFLDPNAVGDDSLDGGEGNDILFGGLGNDSLEGGDGHDILLGTGEIEWNFVDHDVLAGGAGDDVLYGMGGDDVMSGGEGTDVLFGDDYHVDQLFPGPIALQPGLLLQGLVYSTAPGDDVLDGGAGDDFLAGGAGNDILFGGSGNDSLYGDSGQSGVSGQGDDRFTGGLGNDYLDGGGGNDIYEFSLGDGIDEVSDSGQGGNDTIVFGSGITASSVILTPDSDRIFVKVGAGPDGVLLGNVADVFGSQTIEQFQFDDGTTLTYADLIARGFDVSGTANNDVLFGTNLTNRLTGGLGNDTLVGGPSEDTYFFNAGDGIDLIVDSSTPEGRNTVVFGPGITSTQLTLSVASDLDTGQANVLVVRPGNGADAIQLKNLDRTNVFGPHAVDSFQFADGSRLSYQQLLSRGFDLVGTADNDMVLGTNITDRITAGAGDDQVQSGAGDDLLDGGAGDDQLRGESGNDTYVFGPGSGHDRILDEQGTDDVVRLAPGIVSSDVAVTRSGYDLLLRLNGGVDQLTIAHHFLLPTFRIEEIQFSDGSALTSAFLDSPVIQGTQQSDVLGGTGGDDVLVGLGGDDQLSGLAGNDLLDGGTGADTLTGGSGNDTYAIDASGDVVIEVLNEGIDTIQSSVTSTLAANVENLTLTGSGAINGAGNQLDNVLTGNSAANVLAGGLGNDTYVMDAGDTIVEQVGEGTETVEAATSITLGANLENLTLTGSASLTGTGNSLDNVLKADGSISILAGGAGNDTYVIGPNGDDDILVETTSSGIDTVIAAHDYRLPDNIENLTVLDPRIPNFSSFSLVPYQLSDATVSGFGNNLNNTLIGGRANNVLDGGLGADTMIGGAGNDIYVVDNSGDIVTEQGNEGIDTIQSSVTYTLSVNVENLTLTGVASVSGTGNVLNNDIRGNDAPNVLDGGAGADSLQGFGGADTYLFGRGSGRDIVFDSGAAGEVDTIQFDPTVAPGDVEVYRRDYSLVLLISGTSDQLTLASFFDSPGYDQKQVRFADGTVWSSAELSTRAVAGGILIGSSGNDAILGSDADDVLIGAAGDDVLTGGRGNDTLYGDATFQSLSGPQVIGNDTLRGGAGDDSLIDFRGTNLFDGGAGNDSLVLGTWVDTVLFGRGSGVDDVTLDNNGDDIDIIQMAAGISPADIVMTWRSPSNVDFLITDSGDRLAVALSTDFFAVGPETTQAVVRFANGTAWNLAWSSSNVSFPTATPFDDVITGLPGEVLRGLAGNDTYVVGAASGLVIELPGEGIDTVQSAVDYTLPANVENLILQGNFTSVGPYANNATGNELDNLIIGNTRDNILDGGAGNDVLVGGLFRELEGPPYVAGTGSDILIGGQGDDVLMADGGNFSFVGGLLFLDGGLDFQEDVPRKADDLFIGGTGNDTYMLHSQQETVAEFAGEGTDTVQSTVNYTLGDNVENLTLLENPVIFLPGPFTGTGNELDNVLIGNSEDNVLSGGNGNDTLWGGSGLYRDSEAIQSGNDLLIGGISNDTYVFKLGDGNDTIQDVATVGEGNRIQFGVGITQANLTFTQDQAVRTLTIQVGSSGTDKLLLTNFDPTGANGSLVVTTLAFSDGSTASLASLLGLGGPMATNGDDTITTGVGDDVVDALGGNDVVDTGAGNDTVTGGPGNDQLMGGAGNDTYLFNVGDGVDTITDTALPGEGNTLEFGTGITSTDLTLGIGSLLIRVGANGDAIHLTPSDPNDALGAHAIETFRFADGTTLSYDQLIARGFDLTGTAGDDTITGTNLVDRIAGLDGDDTLHGGSGDDTLNGGAGHDLLDGGTGVDALIGGACDDTYVVDDVGDHVTEVADEGTDTIQSSINYTLGANVENLTLTGTTANNGTGNALNNVLIGNSGANVLDGWTGADILAGGAGDDTYVVENVGDVVTEQPNEGTDSVLSAVSYALSVNAENLTLTGATVIDATGNALNNMLIGNSAANRLTGDAGDDVMDGGAGADTLVGGTGDDTYVVENFGDVVTEAANEGTDTVQNSLLAYTLGANVENLTLTGTGPSVGFGNALSNVLTGNSGANLLDGKAGADTMAGGVGDDLYFVDHSDDLVTEQANEGTLDTVSSSVTYSLSANVENLVLTGATAINATGNELDNVLTGNSGANVLTGLGGNDTYIMRAGDKVVEAAGGGTDTVVSGVTHTLSANVEHLTLVGFSAINGTGNALDNVLSGLLNLAGNTLTGGAGNDTYVLGSGDQVVEAANGGSDTVSAGFTYTLGSNVEHLTLTGTGAINGTGNALNNVLTGNSANNVLSASSGNDTLRGGLGNDTMNGGSGNDTFLFGRGDGLDLIQDNSGSADKTQFGTTINPLDLVISRQANDLRLTIHGSAERVTIQNWYNAQGANQIETLQAGNGQVLLSTQVDQLIQAMAGFSQQSSLTWDQAIDQQPQDVQNVLAASWQ